MSLYECISCFSTYKMSEPHYIIHSENMVEATSFVLCEACGRKIIKKKLQKMRGEEVE